MEQLHWKLCRWPQRKLWFRRPFVLVNCLMILVTAALVWKTRSSAELAIYNVETPRHAITIDRQTVQLTQGGTLNSTRASPPIRQEELVVQQVNSGRPNRQALLDGYVAVSNISKRLEYTCGSCAIVSNSGQILKRNAGKEINSNDCVIRMNDSPVLRYEQDVGTKTDIRIISFASIGVFKPEKLFAGIGSAKTVLFWGPRELMEVNGTGRVFNTLKEYQHNFSDVQFYMFTNDKLDEHHNLYEKETHLKIGAIWASTGWFTTLFAKEVCDTITIYGMNHPDFCKQHPSDKTPYHYYNPGGQKECSRYLIHERLRKNVHRYRSERDVFLRWAQSKDVSLQFKHPSW